MSDKVEPNNNQESDLNAQDEKEQTTSVPEADESKDQEPEEESSGDESREEFEEEEDEDEDDLNLPGHPGKVKKRIRKHRKKHRLLRLAIVICVIAALVVTANLPYFAIKQIPVIGNKVVTDKKIRKLSGVKKGDSIFLLNTWRIKGKIKSNLYIDTVTLNREFPSTLEIIVTEREAAAQFVEVGKDNKISYVITDATGMVMGKMKKQQDVTLIERVYATKATEGSQIQVDESGEYKKAMDLIAAAKVGDVYFKKIHIQGSFVEAYIFDTLKCQGRYRNMIDSIESGALKSVVYRLYQEDVSEGTINIGDNNYCSFTPQK